VEALNWEEVLRYYADGGPFRRPLSLKECRQAVDYIDAIRSRVIELEKEIEVLKQPNQKEER